MLSRRDYQKRLREMEQKNEHFSIRKLSVGAASVLIGLSFLGFNTHSAQAAENTDTNTVTKNKAGSITDNTKTFTVGEATTQPVNPKVNITTTDNGDVHMSTTGTPLVQEDAPAYNGGVADSDPTSYTLPEAPMPADTKKGESSVGDATEASSKPKVVISTDKDGNVQMSTTGTPLVQENKPVYSGGVADSDPTSYSLPEAPMPADTKKGESSVGDATEAPSKPKVVITTDKDGNVQMSTTGTPLVQENKPAYNGGVADSNPTSYALSEAPIPSSSASSSASSEASASSAENSVSSSASSEAPASSAENSASSSASSEAPASSAENSANSSASSEAPVSSAENSASSSVATTNTVNAAAHQVSTPVVSRADVHNGMSNTVNHGVVATNQNQSKALPQTGAKANMAGMLGLMVASVGAILGLAVTKKHEN